MTSAPPDFILYAQHGWADNHRAIAQLAQGLATPDTHIVAPSLGFMRTWLRIEPLIQTVENAAIAMMAQYPDTPMRIVGHSMGGLIWLELLNRYPNWWSRVESLVLVASPVGGSDLGRLFDPLSLGLGIARDLGRNRRAIAERIAARIPTLIIAGNSDGGSDGTVTVGCTQFRHASFVELVGLSHATMKNHPAVADAIQTFWTDVQQNPKRDSSVELEPAPEQDAGDIAISALLIDQLLNQLRTVEGMTDGHPRDFPKARVWLTLEAGVTIRTWKNWVGVDHVFVANPAGQCIYSGFVGWNHSKGLQQRLTAIQQQF